MSWVFVKCVLRMEGLEMPCGEEALMYVSGIMLRFLLQWERFLVSCSIGPESCVPSKGWWLLGFECPCVLWDAATGANTLSVV